MIDLIFQIVKTILNKELRGNITPDEFNKIAKIVQDEIFEEYFGDLNIQQNRQNRGLTNKGFANLTQLIRQKIEVFHSQSTLTYNIGNTWFELPSNLYFINDNGLIYVNNVIEESQGGDYGYMSASLASPSVTFPVYELFKNSVRVYPTGIKDSVVCRYIRKPLDPKCTSKS